MMRHQSHLISDHIGKALCKSIIKKITNEYVKLIDVHFTTEYFFKDARSDANVC